MAQCARCGKEADLLIEVKVSSWDRRMRVEVGGQYNNCGVVASGLCPSCHDIIKQQLSFVLSEATAHARAITSNPATRFPELHSTPAEIEGRLAGMAARLDDHAAQIAKLEKHFTDSGNSLREWCRNLQQSLAEHCARRTRKAKSKRRK